MSNNLDAYQKKYKLRLAQGNRKNSLEVTFPYEVVDKEARKRGLTIDEFITRFQAIAQYNGFEGVMYTFEEINNEKTIAKQNNHTNGDSPNDQ
jgi:hypothetical protein